MELLLGTVGQQIRRFAEAGDATSARILTRILSDEVRHVGCGVRWFENACRVRGFAPVEQWKLLVRRHFGGAVKPPFNDSARETAGLTKDFYASLAASG